MKEFSVGLSILILLGMFTKAKMKVEGLFGIALFLAASYGLGYLCLGLAGIK